MEAIRQGLFSENKIKCGGPYVDFMGTKRSGSGQREADICSTRTKINNQLFINGPQCVNV